VGFALGGRTVIVERDSSPPDPCCCAGATADAFPMGVTLGCDEGFAPGGNTVIIGRADALCADDSDSRDVGVALDIPSCPLSDMLSPFCTAVSVSCSCLLIASRLSSAGDNTSTLCGAVMVSILD
jgi:hypothetical protein